MTEVHRPRVPDPEQAPHPEPPPERGEGEGWDQDLVLIRRHYAALKRHYGAQHWWPARSRLEVILGALLTQNTSWINVERALRNLRRARALNLRRLRAMPQAKLASLIRPSGYFRQKARHIKNFIRFLDRQYSGSLRRMLRPRTLQEISALRSELLAVTGIGPETADSVLLYAGNYPVFVVDAYTQRIFARHKIVTKKPISNKKLCHPERGRKRGPRQAPLLRLVGFGMRESRDNAAAFASRPDFVSEKRRANQYEFIRVAVEHALARPMIPAVQKSLGHPPSPMSLAPRSAAAQQLNEFHALIVQVGKNHCFKSQPDCIHCPLRRFLES